ncbi:MAG: ATP-binding cassette domain-containing protein [Spirochaetes bacterium]|jgi:putative ABC transport system ATP-binding protein|nr:ATP-binding cassette domain-containing protein [Spirochaetota bacterium]
MAIVSVRNLEKRYILGKTEVPALRGVSFDIAHGEFISVVGPSGCGKTTLMNIIGCLDEPTAGRVLLDGRDIARFSDNQGADVRLSKMGFIFQAFNLVPVLSVLENVELPMILAGTGRAERRDRAQELVGAVGLGEYASHKPDELSGGQRQRVAIARALVNKPEIVIADEPTANLDSETSRMLLSQMQELNESRNVTFLFATHDPEIMSYARRIIHLRDGVITEDSK